MNVAIMDGIWYLILHYKLNRAHPSGRLVTKNLWSPTFRFEIKG